MINVSLSGIGVLAPGLAGWDAARPILAGTANYAFAALPNPSPDVLPAAERRRAGAVVRLALAVAQEALGRSGLARETVASVFATADGDGENVHVICEALAGNALEISPIRFHNSVQNAPSGYWTIATACRAPTTTVSGLDSIFAQGLLEAATQTAIEGSPTLLVAFDLPMPPPLYALRPLGIGCGVALVLTPPTQSDALARLALRIEPTKPPTPSGSADIETLRLGNPAARGLPLLEAVARRAFTEVTLDYDEAHALFVGVEPLP